jgi:hypothetical protein
MADKPSLALVEGTQPPPEEEAKVLHWEGISYLDYPAGKILRGALESNLEHAVVVGWDSDGDFYFASSYAAGPEVLWLLAQAQRRLLQSGDVE